MAFLRATRQNFLPVQSIDYAAGDTKVQRLPQVGLLARVILIFEGTMTVTLNGGTAALGAEAPFSLIQRLRLVANGNTNLFDCSGYGALIAALKSAYGFAGYGGRPRILDSATVPGPASSTFSAVNYAAGVNAGANTWRFGLEIPLKIADDWRDPIGMVLAAAPDTVLELHVTWGATLYQAAASRSVPVDTDAGALATAALTNAKLYPFVEYFTVPASESDYPDLRRLHLWNEQGPQVIAAAGDQDVVLQRGNTLKRVLHIAWTNSAADATNISQLELRFNQSEVPYSMRRLLIAYLQRQRNVRDLPDGVYEHDLWNSSTFRDAINTLNLNEVTSRLIVGTGATIAGTSDIRTLTEQLVQLTGAVGGSA
jgi:hypothetical protein